MWKHQQEAVEWAKDRMAVLLHLGMGCGKTRVALELLKLWLCSKILVVCPRAVIPAWLKQARMWYPDLRVVLLTKGTCKQKGEELKEALAGGGRVIVVVNYESAWRIAEIEKTAWDALVYDEIHRLKSHSGSASRWAARMGKMNQTARRLGLSGTMLSQNPLDAYGVWRAVESPNLTTWPPTFTAFRARYAIQGNPRIPQQVTGWRNLEEFGTKVALTTFHRRSEDVLDLPPIMHEQVEVELNAQEARVYREIEREFCAVFDDGASVTTANVLVQLLRLLEVCGGAVHRDGNRDATRISERPSKAEALAEILEDLGQDEPVVIFCKYKADVDAIHEECRKLGRTTSELSGRRHDLEEWQAGTTNVLVANTASGGVGVDLTRASYGVFYSVGHSLSEYLQAIARLHRPGQERTTHFYNLVATNGGRKTVDGQVYEALQARQEVLDVIIRGYCGTQPGAAA